MLYSICIVLLLALPLISFFMILLAVKPGKIDRNDQLQREMRRNNIDPDLVNLAFQCWTLRSRRGTLLTARYYANPKGSSQAVLLNHGYNAPWIGVLKYLPVLWKLGFSVLIPDHQAQGESQGKYITYGVLESEDGVDWIEELCQRKGFTKPQIGVMGESMGGATALLIAERMPELAFCVADCPYSDLAKELAYMGRKKYHLPTKLMMPLSRLFFHLLTGCTMEQASPVTNIADLHLPTLLVHGTEDHVVPISMSRELAEANGNITLWQAPEAGHANVIGKYPQEYEEYLCQLVETSRAVV